MILKFGDFIQAPHQQFLAFFVPRTSIRRRDFLRAQVGDPVIKAMLQGQVPAFQGLLLSSTTFIWTEGEWNVEGSCLPERGIIVQKKKKKTLIKGKPQVWMIHRLVPVQEVWGNRWPKGNISNHALNSYLNIESFNKSCKWTRYKFCYLTSRHAWQHHPVFL